jgi:Myb-like DNA-binding domain
LPIIPAALDINHNAATHSKVHQAPLKPKKSKVAWTPEEEATLLQMKNDGCSWEEISAALPRRSIGTIQVRYSTKFKK